MDSYGQGDNTSSSPSDGNKNPATNTDKASDQKGTDSEGGSGEPSGKKRDAEGRINQLVGKVKELEDKLAEVSKSSAPPQTVPGKPEMTPEMEQAAQQIGKLGFQNEEAVNQKIRQLEDRLLLETEHGRLEGKFDGSDGRPKYDRKEVEKFMRDKAVYNPEIAYENLYKKELLEFEIKQAQEGKSATPDSQTPSGERPQGSGDVLTREVIKEKMTTPEWREFYDKNRDKILTLMQKGQL